MLNRRDGDHLCKNGNMLLRSMTNGYGIEHDSRVTKWDWIGVSEMTLGLALGTGLFRVTILSLAYSVYSICVFLDRTWA